MTPNTDTNTETQPASPAAAIGSADIGFNHHRTEMPDATGRLEKALAAQWAERNVPVAGLNYGNGLLQDLCIKASGNPFGPFSGGTLLHKVTNDERRLVATVVQWLGTNCGRGFLIEACREAGWSLSMQANGKDQA